MDILNPASVMAPQGGYSQGIAAGGLVFVAGQVGLDARRRARVHAFPIPIARRANQRIADFLVGALPASTSRKASLP